MTTVMKFEVANGFRIKGDPQKEGEFLEQLRIIKGVDLLKQEDVLAAAEDPKSPIHDEFEWDDDEAAYQYRLQQAGYLLRAIKVQIIDDGTVKMEGRAFLNVIKEEERGYTTLTEVMSNEEFRLQQIRHAIKELDSWSEKYQYFHEISGLLEAVSHAVDKVRPKFAAVA